MNNGKILWADDEIDLLKGHLIFLKNKGYDVTPVSNGMDALEECGKQSFDLIMLDEMMPGLTGLETLQKIKEIQPQTPVIMVTKSEEENLMDQAIGSKIADYLIKPVNPHQILLALKKNIHRKEIESEVTQMTYRSDYQKIAMMIDSCDDLNGLDERLPHTYQVGGGSKRRRQWNGRDACHAKRRGRLGLCQIRQVSLHGMDGCHFRQA